MAIERMQKIFITGEKEIAEDVINFLQEKGLIHINEINRNRNLKQEEEEKRKDAVKIIESCKDFEKELNKIEEHSDIPLDIKKIEKRIFNIIKDYKKLEQKRKEIERQKSLYHRYYEIIKSFLPFIEEEKEKELLGIMIPKKEESALRKLIVKLEKEFKFKMLSRDFKEYRGFVFLIDKVDFEKMKQILTQEGFPEIVFPEEIKEMSFKDALTYLKQRIEQIPREIREITEQKFALISQNAGFLRSAIDFLTDLKEYYEVKDRGTVFTEYLFYIEGYIPSEDYSKIKSEFNDKFSGKSIMVEQKLDPHNFEEVPVKLRNKFPFKPFETLLQFFSLPRYGTIDPSPILFIFFPIYFGFMLGDIGYGAIGLLIFAYLFYKFRSPVVRNLSIVFIFCTLWTLVFGFLYGEMFGDFGEKLGLHPYFHRIEEAETLLLIAIIFGMIQVSLGLFLGFVNQFRLKHLKHAFTNLSMLLGLWSILGLAGVFLNVVPKTFGLYFGVSLLLFAILSAVLHGIVAPVEIFSAFAHILSFARLMAIGLSSAIIPVIANSFKDLFPVVIIGIFAMLLFHILALVLGLFDPTIQGLRLQFVEFFTKFYEAGGKEYKPFLKRFKIKKEV